MRLPWRLVERRLPTNQFPVSSPGKSLRAGVVRVSALGLAARTQAKHAVNIGAKLAVYFSGYWLEHGIVEEPLPGRIGGPTRARAGRRTPRVRGGASRVRSRESSLAQERPRSLF